MDNIPRIGKKIDKTKFANEEQEEVYEVSYTSEENDAVVPSADVQEEKEINSNSVDTPQEPKEYSLKQFRNDFMHILRREVFPKLKPFENSRKKYLKILIPLALTGFPAVTVYSIYLLNIFQGPEPLFLIVLFIALYLWLYGFLKKRLENKVKENVMPMLMKAIPSFYWCLTPVISQRNIIDSDLLPYTLSCLDDGHGVLSMLDNAVSGIRRNYTTDDNFSGSYRGVKIDITECKYTVTKGHGKHRHTETVFEGAVAKIKMNKPFMGKTLVRPKPYSNTTEKYEIVNLEDVKFSKLFKVLSTDQIESRYLITPSFMERFINISRAYKAKLIYALFESNSLYIAIDCRKDLFSLAGLTKTLIDLEQYETLYEEFASILSLVDMLKLDKKLGL